MITTILESGGIAVGVLGAALDLYEIVQRRAFRRLDRHAGDLPAWRLRPISALRVRHGRTR